MRLQVLGTGCAKCKALTANVQAAVTTLGLAAEVEKVEDIPSIMKFGVINTPAFVIDGKVAFAGRVANSTEIEHLLREAT